MPINALLQLIEGHKEFRENYDNARNAPNAEWSAHKQSPKVMIIGCSDSRVNPALLTQAALGDLFIVNNVANLVPAYKEGKDTHHSTSAAIEYAVKHLKVQHIVIMGHSNCGGIRALMEGTTKPEDGVYSFIAPWMEIASPAKEYITTHHCDLPHEEQLHLCEQKSILTSLENLQTFPWVKEALGNQTLKIHAWYFDLQDGALQEYHPDANAFEDILQLY